LSTVDADKTQTAVLRIREKYEIKVKPTKKTRTVTQVIRGVQVQQEDLLSDCSDAKPQTSYMQRESALQSTQ
jgi:hypothetical protein